jgi:hypothetical protein
MWGTTATHPVTGATVDRCPATPSPVDVAYRRELATGTWECGLPNGHQDWPDADGDVDLTRFQLHSWSQTGD